MSPELITSLRTSPRLRSGSRIGNDDPEGNDEVSAFLCEDNPDVDGWQASSGLESKQSQLLKVSTKTYCPK
jgi:hypothetical protein